jgi:hypothetical protein
MRHTRQIKFLIRDRASQFVAAFDIFLRADGATVIRTPVRVPVTNSSRRPMDWHLAARTARPDTDLEPPPARTATP